jgi:hypothetical protein
VTCHLNCYVAVSGVCLFYLQIKKERVVYTEHLKHRRKGRNAQRESHAPCAVLALQLLRHNNVACDRNSSLQALAFSLIHSYRIVEYLLNYLQVLWKSVQRFKVNVFYSLQGC